MLLQAMKLDSGSPYHCPCPHEDDTDVIVCCDNSFILAKDNHFMIDMLSIDKESLKEGRHVLASPIEGRKSYNTADPHKQYLNIEDFFNRDKNDSECVKAPYSAAVSEFEVAVKEDFYTDKIVTRAELPEMKVCTEDDPCHIVKDISIDENVKSSCRILMKKEEGDPMKFSMSNQIIENGQYDSASEIADHAGSGYLKYTGLDSPNTIVDKDQADPSSVLQNDSDSVGSSISSIKSEGNIDMAESLISDDVTENSVVSASLNNATESLVSVNNGCDKKTASASSIDSGEKLNTDKSVEFDMSSEITKNQLSQVNSSGHIFSNDHKQSVNRQKFESITEHGDLVNGALAIPPDVSAFVNESKEISANHVVPSGVITFSFDGEEPSTSGRDENKEITEPSTSGRDENKEITDSQQSEVVQNDHGTEEAMIDGASTSARCTFRHLIQRESNLSGPGLSSGPMVTSGHIPCAGSISFRSESSTTSTRSFAFPILQSEWDSSPVKMAKADRRKRRGCGMGLLCCRF